MGAIGRAFFITIACLAVACTTHRAEAYYTEGLTWANGTTVFNSVVIGGTSTQSTDVATAMQDWNAVTSFVYVNNRSSADPCNDSGANGASLASTDCGDAFGSSVLAVTTYRYTGTPFNSNARFLHAGIVFNGNVNFGSYSGTLITGMPDFRRVAVHELGHVLGLDHETNLRISAIMAPEINNIELPTDDDIAGVASLYGGPNSTSLVAAILPSSRSVLMNQPATFFATIINTGKLAGINCRIYPDAPFYGSLATQPTDPATNVPVGTPNVGVSISAGKSQSFVLTATPYAVLPPTDIEFSIYCFNAPLAPSISGVNTLLLSASTTPVADIVALVATSGNDGYVHVGSGHSSGAFAVATVNVGAADTITVSADTGSASLPVAVMLCQTNPQNGQCITSIQPSVITAIGASQTPTFAVFVNDNSFIAPDPANKRIFVRFRDSQNAIRGATSVAVTSQ